MLTNKARGDRVALKALALRIMRLNVVHEHAKRKIAKLSFVDDVCVYLRFEIELQKKLDLPVCASTMIFYSYIPISEEELLLASNEAEDIDDQQVEAWLTNWSEWQRQVNDITIFI